MSSTVGNRPSGVPGMESSQTAAGTAVGEGETLRGGTTVPASVAAMASSLGESTGDAAGAPPEQAPASSAAASSAANQARPARFIARVYGTLHNAGVAGT
jgi:hypothetical protein